MIAHRILAVAATLAACGQPYAADQIVPIEQEPQHQLKFQNRHVRFFDVNLPPGYEGLLHSHIYDGVFVNIETAETREQVLGSEPKDRPPRNIGDTYFLPYATSPKVHRVDNIGSSPYRVTDTEILAACGGFSSVTDGEGQTLIVENDRVRVTRVMLSPGQTLALHPPCGMLVAVAPGILEFSAPGGTEFVDFDPGGFKWRDSSAPLEFTNKGDSVFHGVDIVVK